MKIAGIVAEFNPFHYGHEYLISKITEDGANRIVVAMSPNFTMRGEPAIFSKKDRASIAISKGVDLVVEIPTIYTIQSADIYAYTGVKILSYLKVTDLYFGVESTDTSVFYKIVESLNSDEYKSKLKEYLDDGISFNNSSKKALGNINPSYNEILSSPNNTLAIFYLLAIKKLGSNIKPHFIKRIESGYFDEYDANKKIQSGTALRKIIETGKKGKYFSYNLNNYGVHVKNDYFSLLKYRILSIKNEELKNIQGINEGLENKIKSLVNFKNYEELISTLTSKRNRNTKIQRILLAILLNINKNECSTNNIDYIHVLGLNSNGRSLLKEIKDEIKIITKVENDLPKSFYRELDFSKIYNINSLDEKSILLGETVSLSDI